jgi:hydroxyacyl-ACP dehydratase HTD2-like protein with hotdog domain
MHGGESLPDASATRRYWQSARLDFLGCLHTRAERKKSKSAFKIRHDFGYIWNFGLIGQNKNLRKRDLIN